MILPALLTPPSTCRGSPATIKLPVDVTSIVTPKLVEEDKLKGDSLPKIPCNSVQAVPLVETEVSSNTCITPY